MAQGMQVSGPAGFAKRTDKDRAAKIQRDAKIQNANNGTYGQRAELQGLASGAPTQAPMGAVARGEYATPMAPQTPGVGIFEPTQRKGEPVTAGVDNGTPGVGSNALQLAPDSPDQLSVLARAMFMQNPTPQLRRLIEAFQQEGR